MAEPSTEARQEAFNILARHPDCIRDDVVMNDLIDDIAQSLDAYYADARSKAGMFVATQEN